MRPHEPSGGPMEGTRDRLVGSLLLLADGFSHAPSDPMRTDDAYAFDSSSVISKTIRWPWRSVRKILPLRDPGRNRISDRSASLTMTPNPVSGS